MSRSKILLQILPAMLAVLAAADSAPRASLDVTLDAATLDRLLQLAVPPHVDVEVPVAGTVRLFMDEVRVRGFEPASGVGDTGRILTDVQVRVPSLGIQTTLHPKLQLVVPKDGAEDRPAELRFTEAVLPLPMIGPTDVAGVLPAVPMPQEGRTQTQGGRGWFDVKIRLVDARTGARSLRLRFELQVHPAPGPRLP